MEKDRWEQRYKNLQKAFGKLESAVTAATLSALEKEGMVQRFEYTFELAWKTMKDYMESRGLVVLYPRDVIKEAFKAELIDDGELWLEMLDSRNLRSHTYDEAQALVVFDLIQDHYFFALAKFVDVLSNSASAE